MLKAIIIRLDRADGPFPEPNHVEWHRPSQPPAPNPQNPSAAAAAPPEPFSAFTLTRTGSEDVRVFIALHLDQAPERVKVNPALGHFLDVTEESMPGIVQALWAYVKKERLQDGEDKRFIRKDGNLAYVRLFGAPSTQALALTLKSNGCSSSEEVKARRCHFITSKMSRNGLSSPPTPSSSLSTSSERGPVIVRSKPS